MLRSSLDELSFYHSPSLCQKVLFLYLLKYTVNLSTHLLGFLISCLDCWTHLLIFIFAHSHFILQEASVIPKKANKGMSFSCLKPFIFMLHFINLQSFCLFICLSAYDYNPPLEFMFYVRKPISAYLHFLSTLHSAWQ